MASVLQMVKSVVGAGTNLGDLIAELDAARARGVAAHAELERLESVRLHAETFEAAEAANARIARVTWEADRLAAVIPELESQIAIAKNAKQKAAIARHAAINRKSWPKLRAAIEAAVNAQAELIRQREEAVRDVGEHAVTLHLPVAAFAGFLHREHFDIWAKELDRVMAEPAPKSAPAPVAAVVTAKPVAKNPVADVRTSADSRESAAEPAKPRPLRQPRRDKVSVGGRLVTILRTGVEIGDQQLHAGDQISVSMEQAEQLLRNGAAELVSAAS